MDHCPRCHLEVDEHDDALLDALGHVWHVDCAGDAPRARFKYELEPTTAMLLLWNGDVIAGDFFAIADEARRRAIYVERMVR